MWTCPHCGRTYKNTNQWHSCVTLTVEDFLAAQGTGAPGRRLFAAFRDLVESMGPVRIHPQKTCLAFIATMSFAGVTRVRDDWMDCSLILRREARHPLLSSVEAIPVSWFAHTFRARSVEEVQSLRDLVAEAHAVGQGDSVPLEPEKTARGAWRRRADAPR